MSGFLSYVRDKVSQDEDFSGIDQFHDNLHKLIDFYLQMNQGRDSQKVLSLGQFFCFS